MSDGNKMRHLMFDIFKQPLTHISSIPEGCVEWLLVMLEQVLDVSEAFDLEDLRFFLDDFPEIENRIIQTVCVSSAWPSINVISARRILLLTTTHLTNKLFKMRKTTQEKIKAMTMCRVLQLTLIIDVCDNWPWI